MDRQDLFTVAAYATILASGIKVWEFLSTRPWFKLKKLLGVLHLPYTRPVHNKSITPSAGTLRINVFDTIPVGDLIANVSVRLTGQEIRSNPARRYDVRYDAGEQPTPFPMRFL